MRISGKDLFHIVPGASACVHSGTAVSIIRQRYCSRVHTAGYCSSDCANCADHLQRTFGRLQDAHEVRSPAGLLTYLARDEAVKYIEKARSKEKQAIKKKGDELFQSPTRNPFLSLLEGS